MAEFQEVMRQAKRMCEANCEECPLSHTVGDICPIAVTGNDEIAEIESIVMNWAAEHPEPMYPTWEEWHKAKFPEIRHPICPIYFTTKKPLGTCAVSCAKCANTPIPADIAEKLGIKPIGGKDDA